MSKTTEEYEWARKVLKRESKDPNPYTRNRQKAMLDRVHKMEGDKGVKEIMKEFWRK